MPCYDGSTRDDDLVATRSELKRLRKVEAMLCGVIEACRKNQSVYTTVIEAYDGLKAGDSR
jgi:hypothetical protein